MVTLQTNDRFESDSSTRFPAPDGDNPIAETVLRLLSNNGFSERRIERRHEKRHAFSNLLTLTPVCPQTFEPVGDRIRAVGRQISTGGLDFFYNGLLTDTHVLFHPNSGLDDENSLLLKLKWCHYLGDGWYLTGGQFIDVVLFTGEIK